MIQIKIQIRVIVGPSWVDESFQIDPKLLSVRCPEMRFLVWERKTAASRPCDKNVRCFSVPACDRCVWYSLACAFVCTQRAKIIQDLKIRKGARKKIRPAECQGIRLFLSGYWPPHSLITNVMFIPLSCLYPVRHVMYRNSISCLSWSRGPRWGKPPHLAECFASLACRDLSHGG